MKKSLFILACISMALFAVSCGNNQANETKAEPEGTKLTLCDKTSGSDSISVDFWYPENAGVKEIEVFGTNDACKTLADSAENYKIELRFTDGSGSTFENKKQSDISDANGTFKEFKIGDYQAYGYETYRTYDVVIAFEVANTNTENVGRYARIKITELLQGDNKDAAKDFFEKNEVVKGIINSVRYNGPKTDADTDK